MKVAQINAVCSIGSTGKICASIADLLTKNGIENRVYYNNRTSSHPCAVRYGTDIQLKRASLSAHLLGNWGFEGKAATRELIKKLDGFQPDIIQLHNLHSHACNLEILFSWIKEKRVKVFWTFHDCWAYTGGCMYYDAAGCERWKTGCGDCPQKKAFSYLFDCSASMYKKKKALFSDLNLTIITPSKWLADEVKRSFLRDHPVKVIYNGIDLNVFSPAASDFKERYGIKDKKIVLGVAMEWGKRKGLDVFIELSERLKDDYKVVLAGVDSETAGKLPSGIVTVPKTKSANELAEIYSAADVFVDPTREDNFPTVNLEALACGTPVVTFRTGGSPEALDETCGAVVEKNDVDALEHEIRRVCETKPYSREACRQRAEKFGEADKFMEYILLYIDN